MLICPNCQFTNPLDHKFCQRCGEPLLAAAPVFDTAQSAAEVANQNEGQHENQPLQATLMPPDLLKLSPAAYLALSDRYQIITVLAQGSALIEDKTPDVRSPLQQQLGNLAQASLPTLRSVPELPAAAYPYLLLCEAAPSLYDAWQQGETTYLITHSEQPALSSLIQSFSSAVDPLQHVYWLYRLTDLWLALEAVPQWRSSLLLANNIGIDSEQSVRIRQFIEPALQPPQLADLKAFLQSLLAQPHRGAIAPLRQIRQIILTVTASNTLEQLRSELAAIGESLLATPAAITPAISATSAEAMMPHLITTGVTQTQAADAKATSDEQTDKQADKQADTLRELSSEELNRALDIVGDTAGDTAGFGIGKMSVEDLDREKPLIEEPLIEDMEEDIDLPEPVDSDESTMVLPMKLIDIASAGRTDVGRQRDHNEDRFFIASSTQKQADNGGQTTHTHSLYVLCDGMGGHAGGEIASRIAAETLSAYFSEHWPHPLPGATLKPLPTEAAIVEAVRLANQAIYDINEKEDRAGSERMGTTLVMVLVQGPEAVVAHVGDSRLYQHTRRMGLRQITTDHEVGQREIQRGVPKSIAYARPDAYQLTQALGPRGSAELAPSISYLTFSEDTLLLLCSDGLSDNNLVEEYLSSHIDPILRGKKEIEAGVDELIDLGNQVNGHDNISAIAIRLKVSPDLGKMQGTTTPRPQQTIIQ
jgi:protein phosphatase